jgi:hypothetical protein
VVATVPNHLLCETALLKAVNSFPNAQFRELSINASNAIGQHFFCDVTGAGVKWDLGAIRVMARAADANTDGVMRVRVTRADTTTKLPIAPILAEVLIAESSLGPSYRWLDIPIAPICQQTQTTALCLTMTYASGTGNVANIQLVENGTGMPANTTMITSVNGGTTWTAAGSTQALRFYAYGLYDGYSGNRDFASSVDLQLTSSRAGLQKIQTSVRLLSVPEIP